MKHTTFVTTSLAVAVGLFAIGAQAQSTAPTEKRMTIGQIATLLEGQGYKVLEIDLERGRYDVEMIDGKGMKVEAYLNPVNGDVLPYQDDDDDRDRDDRYDD